MVVVGYPVVFGVPSVDLSGFQEQIAPQAVDRTLRHDLDVVALHNHNSDHPLGRRSSGTLTLHKDSTGLRIELDLDERVSYAADLARVIRRGDAIGGSFGFRTIDDTWTMRNDVPFRTVLDMTVTEISVGVTFPAYPQTQLSMRSSASHSTRSDTRSVAFLMRLHRQRLARTDMHLYR